MARANMALAIRKATQKNIWDHQVILVTSAIPGEGKSITAAGVARSIARAGRSVVLVDADMRRPAQNHLFNTAEESGLADVLEGQMELSDAIVATEIDTLGVLHSGHPQDSPTELLSHPRMAETIAKLREEAEVIIIDTPACSVVADAFVLAPNADCILQVVGTGQTDRELVRMATDALMAAEPETMLYFVNRAPRERTSYARSHYYMERATPALSAAGAHGGVQGEKSDEV